MARSNAPAEPATVEIDSEVSETVIGSGTKFTGTITTAKPIKIDGQFDGTINSTNLVVVSEVGYAEGTINCESFQLNGRGKGNAHCAEVMRFAPSGVYQGEIETKNIVIVEGSVLDGDVKIIR